MKVRSLANTIRLAFKEQGERPIMGDDDEPEFLEGRLVTVLHRKKERDSSLRKRVLADRRSSDRGSLRLLRDAAPCRFR